MPKRRLNLKVRIPHYEEPRNFWLKEIHKNAVEQEIKTGVRHQPEDKLEVIVRLYSSAKKLQIIDVDNRLKDILDALLGRAGGGRKIAAMKPVIQNNNQIYQVVIEKIETPEQTYGMGYLVVRKFSDQ